MEIEEAETTHIGHEQGAINTHDKLSIAVDLQSKGKAAVKAEGFNKEHNLWVSPSGNRNTDDSTVWTTTWKGSWVVAKGTLTLSLTLVKHDCKAERNEDGRIDARGTCQTPSNTAKLTCTAQKLSVAKDNKARDIDAWSCVAADKTELAESTRGWTFGKKQCVRQIGGHRTPISWTDC